MKTALNRRLSELEQQAEPEEGMTIVDLGNGSLEMRWNGMLLNRIRKDLYEELLSEENDGEDA